jgi:hypothetical protein
MGFARTRKVIGGNAVFQAADLTVVGAQTAIFRIPKDFVVTGWFGPAIPKLDSGAALTFNLGDFALPTRYLTASTVGQAGGAIPAFPAGSLYYQYPIDVDMLLTVVAAAAGLQAAANITLYLEGFIAP